MLLDKISIHVLREEDDKQGIRSTSHTAEFQSTSSARRTTCIVHAATAVSRISIHVLREEDDCLVSDMVDEFQISIHVLREEDDTTNGQRAARQLIFQSTSSARRTTPTNQSKGDHHHISIHVLREEDDKVLHCNGKAMFISIHVLREEDDTRHGVDLIATMHISIHVLREEDDASTSPSRQPVYIFQSTSSARRTTGRRKSRLPRGRHFNPRPPRGGRLHLRICLYAILYISIHVLREEDDKSAAELSLDHLKFQSTSSARRTTIAVADFGGADAVFQSTSSARRTTRHGVDLIATMHISIHVLREEDDRERAGGQHRRIYFNPRPPRGGRHQK